MGAISSKRVCPERAPSNYSPRTWRDTCVYSAQVRAAPSEITYWYGETAARKNIFAYVGGNPLQYIDPEGLMGRGNPTRTGPSATDAAQKAMGCLCKADSRFCIPKTAVSAAPADWLDNLVGVLPAAQTSAIVGNITVNSDLFSPSQLADSGRLFDLFWALAHEWKHRERQNPWQRWYTQAIDSVSHDAIDNEAFDFVRQHQGQLMQCFREGCSQ